MAAQPAPRSRGPELAAAGAHVDAAALADSVRKAGGAQVALEVEGGGGRSGSGGKAAGRVQGDEVDVGVQAGEEGAELFRVGGGVVHSRDEGPLEENLASSGCAVDATGVDEFGEGPAFADRDEGGAVGFVGAVQAHGEVVEPSLFLSSRRMPGTIPTVLTVMRRGPILRPRVSLMISKACIDRHVVILQGSPMPMRTRLRSPPPGGRARAGRAGSGAPARRFRRRVDVGMKAHLAGCAQKTQPMAHPAWVLARQEP